MYATDDLGDAVDATKGFLLPFDYRRWLRIAFVTFFLGGVGMNFSSPSVATEGGDLPPGPPPEGIWAMVAGALIVVLLVALAFAAVRGVMDLVLLESLREEEVDLQRFWSARWRQGLRLFGFRIGVSFVAYALLALPIGFVVLGAESGGGEVLVALGVLLLIPVLLVVPLGLVLLNGFTTAFVAPVMLLEDEGVLSAWRRFWPTLVDDWTEFAGYVVVNFVLVLAASILLSLALAIGAVVVSIPLAPLFGLAMALSNVVEVAGLAVFAFSAVVWIVVVVVVSAFAKAPLIVFLRLYALFVLGDVDDDLDLIPVIRKDVRAAEE